MHLKESLNRQPTESHSNRLIGVCGWVGWHFLHHIDYNGVVCSMEVHVLEWGHILLGFQGSRKFWYVGILKNVYIHFTVRWPTPKAS